MFLLEISSCASISWPEGGTLRLTQLEVSRFATGLEKTMPVKKIHPIYVIQVFL